MLCIALTGNIATGKSTVTKEFERFGAEIINADEIARSLTRPGNEAYNEIIDHFGSSILVKDKSLNRMKLREIIFSNPSEKKWLEELLHPLIRDEIEKRVQKSKAKYSIVEIPLQFNPSDYPYIDRVLLIHAPEDKQISRIIKRDNCSPREAKLTLKSQPTLEKRLSIADDVIYNEKDIDSLKKKVSDLNDIYQSLLNKS